MRISTVVFCLPLVGCHADKPGSSTAADVEAPPLKSVHDPSLVRFTVEPVAPPRGARAAVRLSLTNVSEQWLWLNYGFTAAWKGSASSVWIDIADRTSERELVWHCSGKSLPGGAPLYIMLAPGSSYSAIGLLDCFLPQGHASVRVTGRYLDRELRPPRPHEPGAYWFRGEVVSNTIEIEIPEQSGTAGP
jgi:hypothetical protein